MPTGRQLAERTLRPLMEEVAWRPRAAGWFTKQVAPGFLGVISVDVASKGYTKGSGTISLFVGLRDEALEPVVAKLCATEDHAYQGRTVVRYIGYVMPERTFLKWYIDADVADEVCAELVRHVVNHADPYLAGLTSDQNALSAEMAATGFGWMKHCRIAVRTFQLHGRVAADEYLARINFDLPIQWQMLERLSDWMSAQSA
ncbi:MAG TPA: hypothetical protein VF086_10495 [Propionibacteriaceae bacterium]